MRVLHFFKTYWPDTFGGVERSIHAIATGTVRHGVVTDVLSLSRDPAAGSREFDGHMAWKAKLDLDIASTGLSRAVFGQFRALADQADIIHYHFPWPLMDIVHMTCAPKKPALVTYHSDIVKQRTLLRFYRPLMMRFLRSMDAVVATSPDYLRSSEVLRALDPEKIAVIPLGMEETSFPAVDEATRARWRAALPRDFFLFVGVLRYYKGVHRLLDAARLTGLPVVIVGEGPLGEELRARAKAENLDNVIFTGALDDLDKMALLELCAAFVFPSHLRSEAFGLSLVEAAMSAKPMISCEIGTGSSYVNRHGETGLVVEPDNGEALAGAMRQLAADEGLRRIFGENARRRYEENFTASRMADAYHALYSRLLSKPLQ